MDVVLFLMPVPATIVIAALVALAPAVVNAWRDRTLLARVDDPALPERLLATRWWVASSFGLSFGLLVAIWPWQAFWTVPLLLLSRRWMAFRLRRTLLGESWSFFLYLNFFARTALAVPAFSLLLLGTPIIVWAADDAAARWAVAATLGLLLTLWQLRHTQLLLWLWRATPIARARQVEGERNGEGDVQSESEGERGDLTAAFEAVIAKARVASPPRVWQAGPAGAVVANAVALPSVSGAEVVFSRTLLERMTVDELVAVFAHEVAHLEYFNRARMMRQRMLTLSQIFAGALLVPLLATFAPGTLLPAMALWPLFVLLTTIGRTAKVHGNELASDRRAIELCENPDALMSGLTKIHTIGRLPRRWDAHATKHPSLARRMRAIRELAGFRAPAIEQVEIFVSPSGDSFLLLDRAMLQYAAGVPPAAPPSLRPLETPSGFTTLAASAALASPEAHAASTALAAPLDADTIITRAHSVRRVPYTSLKSCRIVARWKQPAALRVTDQAGRTFEAALRDADLPRLHDLLDIIEFGLPVDTPAPLFNERAIAFGLLIVAVCVGHVWSLALLATLALVRPAAEMLISAALALSVTGALQWIDPTNSVSASPVPAWVLVALGGVAIDLVLWRLWSGRAARISLPPWCIAIILGSALLVWMHGLLQWDGSLLRLAQVARVTPAAVLLPLGAVLLVARSRLPLRWVLASVLLIAGLVPAAMTTRWFQDDIVRDPLLSVDAPLPITSAIVDMIGAAYNERGDELRISPEGHSVAMAEADEESEISDFMVRTPDHQMREVGAADLQFLDDNRAVVLVNESAGLIVRLENFTGKSAMPRRVAPESVTPWSVTLPNVRWGRLSIAPHTQRWRVIGRDGRNQVVRAQGIIGSAEYDDVRWRMEEGGRPLVGSGNAMLVTRTDWRASLLGRLLPELAMATSTRSSFDVSMWRVRTGAPALMTRSSADVDCLEPPVDLEPAVCFAFDGIATRVWTISADDKRVAPMGVLRGYARPLTRGADGTVVAWWRNHPVLLQVDPLRARELPSVPMSKWGRAALASDYLLIADEPGATTLAIYRVQSSSASEYTRRNEPAR